MSECDVSDTIVAKSDQLNADDLLAGPITVTITGVKRCADEQPVAVQISGGHQPWKPCKTMRRVLVSAWGKDGSQWVGKSLRLVRDASVIFGGKAVGGIRIEAMSHIPKRIEMYLAESRGKKKLVTIDVLESQREPSRVEKYQKRISELTTANEIKVAHGKFDAVRAEMSQEEQNQIEAAFAAKLKAITP